MRYISSTTGILGLPNLSAVSPSAPPIGSAASGAGAASHSSQPVGRALPSVWQCRARVASRWLASRNRLFTKPRRGATPTVPPRRDLSFNARKRLLAPLRPPLRPQGADTTLPGHTADARSSGLPGAVGRCTGQRKVQRHHSFLGAYSSAL